MGSRDLRHKQCKDKYSVTAGMDNARKFLLGKVEIRILTL
jgi:hypothetical protein